jgi:hypothetical protein
MVGSWLLLWMLFMFLFFIAPLSYGMGYRSWGMPTPSWCADD